MTTPTVKQRFTNLDRRWSKDDYNFEHFGMRELLFDARQMLGRRGIHPGEKAPNFDLPTVGGRSLRLSDFRGRVVLLHFGSYT